MSSLNLPVEEFTTPNPVTVTEDADLGLLSRLMRDHDIRHLPIIKNEKVAGVVSDRDVKLAMGLTEGQKAQVRAADIMALDPVTVNASATLDDVAFEMSRKKIGSVIVNDDMDRFMGIFTVTDALNALIEIARSAKREP